MRKQKADMVNGSGKMNGMKSVATKSRCVDLFCGCGGVSLGFEKAGFDGWLA